MKNVLRSRSWSGFENPGKSKKASTQDGMNPCLHHRQDTICHEQYPVFTAFCRNLIFPSLRVFWCWLAARFNPLLQCCGSGSEIRCLFWPLDPGSGMGEKSRSGSGMNILDHTSESLETIFWVKILKFFNADPGSGNLLDPGSGIRDGKNSDPG